MAQGIIKQIASGQQTSQGKPKWGVLIDDTWHNTTNAAFEAAGFKIGDYVTLESDEFHGSMWFQKFAGQPNDAGQVAAPKYQGTQSNGRSAPQEGRTPKDRWIFAQALIKSWVAPSDDVKTVGAKCEAAWTLSGTVGRAAQSPPEPPQAPPPSPEPTYDDPIPF